MKYEILLSDTENPPVELRGGSRPSEGNVYVNGAPVHHSGWDEKDAAVVCRMLG